MPSAPGKPPHRIAIVEAQVRNPLTSPVWLLYDLGGGLPSSINSMTLSRTSPLPRAHVWSFDGNGAFQAVRLPPGADLVLRELELSAYAPDQPFLLAFATSVTMAGRPAESWADRPGILPAAGEFTLTSLTAEFEWEAADEMEPAPLAVRVLCVHRFDPNGPESP